MSSRTLNNIISKYNVVWGYLQINRNKGTVTNL